MFRGQIVISAAIDPTAILYPQEANFREDLTLPTRGMINPVPIRVRTLRLLAIVALAVGLGGLPPAAADEVADFYRGRQIQVVIGHEVGGGYDVYGRLLGRFLTKHLPGNPRVIPQNMVGAGSRKAANWLYNIAPRDGSVIGVTAQTTPLDQALKQEGVSFDAAQFNWIGNPIIDNQVFFAWHTSGIRNLEDAVAKGGLICGGTGASTNPVMLPKIINHMLGANIRVVAGYQGANNVLLAMERGEVNCIGSHSWSTAKVTVAHHLRENKLNMLVQWGPSKDPEISDIRQARGAADVRLCAHRLRPDRGQADEFGHGDRASALRAARRSAGPGGRSAQGVRRHHEGSRIPGGGEEDQCRYPADVGHRAAGAGDRGCADPARDRRQDACDAAVRAAFHMHQIRCAGI